MGAESPNPGARAQTQEEWSHRLVHLGFPRFLYLPLLRGLYPSCASVIGWPIIRRFSDFLFSRLIDGKSH